MNKLYRESYRRPLEDYPRHITEHLRTWVHDVLDASRATVKRGKGVYPYPLNDYSSGVLNVSRLFHLSLLPRKTLEKKKLPVLVSFLQTTVRRC